MAIAVHMKRGRTKTDQQYLADILKLMSSQYDKKAKALKAAALKQTVLFRPKISKISQIIFAENLEAHPVQFSFLFHIRHTSISFF